MPSEQQLIQIYRLSGKGSSRTEIAEEVELSIRTVDRALLVQREHKSGLELTEATTGSGWKSKSLDAALSAMNLLETEQIEASAKPGIVQDIAQELSQSLGVPATRNVLAPGSKDWIGHGLFGPIRHEPKFHIAKEPRWRIFNEEMPASLRGSLSRFQKALMSYGRSIKAMHRVCSSNLPEEFKDPNFVRSPEVAEEAAVLSMLNWLRQPKKIGTGYAEEVRREFLPQSINTNTLSLGAWKIETARAGVTEKLFLDLLESSEVILESREAERFRRDYETAAKATETLRSDLFYLSAQ